MRPIIFRNLSTSRYLVNHLKPRVPMNKPTDPQNPPKYIYENRYLEEHYPLQFGGYPDHHHGNPFIEEASNAYQLFNYQYDGHWWDIGWTSLKFLAIATPFLLGFWVYSINVEKSKRGLGGLNYYFLGQGYAQNSSYNSMEF